MQTGRINIFLLRYNFNKFQINELVEKMILLIVFALSNLSVVFKENA